MNQSFSFPGNIRINANQKDMRQNTKVVTDTTYTLTDADHGFLILFDSTSPILVIVPPNLRTGEGRDFGCIGYQFNTGNVTFSASVGATVRNADNQFTTEKQDVYTSVVHLTSNIYTLDGRLS